MSREGLPLTYAEIVDEIVQFTTLGRDEVEYRVWMQALLPGWNVMQDVIRFGVTLHVSDARMDRLYEQGDGFIFETLVFWARPERRRWIQQTLERIRLYAGNKDVPADELAILLLGDGTGNDSLYLANHGLKVDYFDVPGSKTAEFAMRRFATYGFLHESIRLLADYKACLSHAYDVVVSFDVLEHLPEPIAAIQDISDMLKIGGIAVITEDFGDIIARLPTHLRVSEQCRGRTPFLFLKNGMRLSWYNRDPVFKPMEFVRVTDVSIRDWLRLIWDYEVRAACLSRYASKLARLVEGLPYLRPPRT